MNSIYSFANHRQFRDTPHGKENKTNPDENTVKVATQLKIIKNGKATNINSPEAAGENTAKAYSKQATYRDKNLLNSTEIRLNISFKDTIKTHLNSICKYKKGDHFFKNNFIVGGSIHSSASLNLTAFHTTSESSTESDSSKEEKATSSTSLYHFVSSSLTTSPTSSESSAESDFSEEEETFASTSPYHFVSSNLTASSIITSSEESSSSDESITISDEDDIADQSQDTGEHLADLSNLINSWANDNFNSGLSDYLYLQSIGLKNYTFNLAGIKPENLEIIRTVGEGSFKTISLASAERAEIKGGNSDKKTHKQVALAEQKYAEKLTTMDALSIATELRMGKFLASKPEASKYIGKVYYVGMHDGRLHSVTKYANGGPVHKMLPTMDIQQKKRCLAHVAKGLSFLHKEEVVHNDVAARNILVHKKNNDVKFLLSDFGACTFNADNVSPIISVARPPDTCSPERYDAIQDLGEAQNNRDITEMTQSAKLVKEATTAASDAFSFGVALCDAILRPKLITDLNDTTSAEAKQYTKLYQGRRLQWQDNFWDFDKGEYSNRSALSPEEYQKLNEMDPQLATLVNDLMAFNPNNRPTLERAAEILEG
jgi:hypothetical protein